MTVPSTTSAIVSTADGTTATFAYTWQISQASDLIVYRTAVGATTPTLLTLTTDYTVSGAGVPTGGTITLTAGNPASGTRIYIASDPSQVQSLLLQQAATYNPADVMAQLDYLTREVQANRRLINQSLKIPVTESQDGYGTTLPLKAGRTSGFPYFDANGNAQIASGAASTPISTAMTPVVSAATLSAARAAMGLTSTNNLLGSVATIAALKALATTDLVGDVIVEGYAAAGDGGGGVFRWNSGDSTADNAGTVIQPNTLPSTGRWNRLLGDDTAINVKWFGAKGDGTTDDTSAIQAAITALNANGGIVWFTPQGIYPVSATIDIKSKAPIYLVSQMGPSAGPSYSISDLSFGGYIKPTATLANGIFRFAAPAGAASRAEHGGGGCVGLHFADPGNRATSIYAAINAVDFNLSVIRDCMFHWLLGSAIVLDQSVMSSIDRCIIRYCGDTSKPALLMGVTNSGVAVVQSTTVRDVRSEVNYSAPYMSLPSGGTSGNNKIIGCGFESDTATAGTQQTFIDEHQSGTLIEGCHFNRNSARALNLDGTDGTVTGCGLYGNGTSMSVPTVEMTSNSRRYKLQGLTLRGYTSQLATCIKDSGQWNSVANASLYFTGNIDVSAAVGCKLTSVDIIGSITTQTYAITLGDSCGAIGCMVDNQNAGSIKGICLTANAGVYAIGCVVKNTNNQNAYDVLSSVGRLIACDAFNLGTGKMIGTYTAGSDVYGGPNALRGTAVIDPPSCPSQQGIVLGTTITVPGAAVGDAVLVSSNGDSNGLILGGVVTAASTVKVSMFNPTSGAVDLGSCTFTARIVK